MKKFSLLFVSFVCLFFVSCNFGSNKANTEGMGKVTIGTSARTITPVDWEIDDCNSWSVTFKSEYTTITKTFEGSWNEERTYELPVGKYDITVDGTYNYGTAEAPEYHYITGSKTDIEVKADTPASVYILLSLKKTEDGTGSFEYVITAKEEAFFIGEGHLVTTNPDDVENYVTVNGYYKLGAYLTPVTEGDQIWLDVSCTEIDEGGTNKLKFVLANKEGESIKSGYYYLSVSYILNDLTYPFELPDPLVEVADNEKTTDDFDTTESDFTGFKVKNLYISNKAEDNYSGLTPGYKKEVNKTLEWLNENQSAWTEANLYFQIAESETTNYLDIIMQRTPKINVPVVNPTANNYGKVVKIYVGEMLYYIFSNGNIDFYGYPAGGSAYYFYNPSDEKETVSLSTTDIPTEFTLVTVNTNLELTINQTEIITPKIQYSVKSSDCTAYDSETSEPILTVTYNNIPGELADISLSVFDNDGEMPETTDYTSVNKKEYITVGTTVIATKQKLFTAKKGTSSVTVSKYLPDFTISASNSFEKVFLMDGSTSVKYTIVTGEGATFVEGTKYTWFLNGKDITTDNTKDFIEIDFSKNSNTVLGNNTLMAVATFNGVSASKTKAVTVEEPFEPGVVQFNYNDGYGRWETSYNGIPSTSYPESYNSKEYDRLLAYCYDEDGNFYTSLYSYGKSSSTPGDKTYRIDKYTYNKATKTYSETPVTLWKSTADDANGSPVRMACDGKNVYFRRSTSQYNIAFAVAEGSNDKTSLYYVSTTTPEDPTAVTLNNIDLSSYYDRVTAVAAVSGKLYVGGEKSVEDTTTYKKVEYGTEQAATVYKDTYSVKEFAINSNGSINTTDDTDYISFTNEDLLGKLKVGELALEAPATADYPYSDMVLSFGCVVSDIVAGYGKPYILLSYNAKKHYSRYSTSNGAPEWESKYKAGGIVVYKDNSTQQFIDISGEKTTNGCGNSTGHNHTEFMGPTRILAIKPKELVLCDSNGDSDGLYETLNLDSKEIILAAYGYGYTFDRDISASGEMVSYYNIDTKAVSYTNSDYEGAVRTTQ